MGIQPLYFKLPLPGQKYGSAEHNKDRDSKPKQRIIGICNHPFPAVYIQSIPKLRAAVQHNHAEGCQNAQQVIMHHSFFFHSVFHARLLPPPKAIHSCSLHLRTCPLPSYYPNLLIRSTASIVFSRLPKAVSLKYPSPLGPKPEPGVPTTFTSSSR